MAAGTYIISSGGGAGMGARQPLMIYEDDPSGGGRAHQIPVLVGSVSKYATNDCTTHSPRSWGKIATILPAIHLRSLLPHPSEHCGINQQGGLGCEKESFNTVYHSQF